MKSKTVCALVVVAIVEAMIIVVLTVNRTHFVVKTQLTPVRLEPSPIALALEYEAPDKKFEEVVKKNLGWLSYRTPFGSYSILAACARRMRTNYVRILIENGADVEEAAKELKAMDQDESVSLLKQVQSEQGQSTTNNMPRNTNR